MKISIETEVNAPLSTVWDAWVTPEDITRWNFAIDEWCCPRAELDLKAGGSFNYHLQRITKLGSAPLPVSAAHGVRVAVTSALFQPGVAVSDFL